MLGNLDTHWNIPSYYKTHLNSLGGLLGSWFFFFFPLLKVIIWVLESQHRPDLNGPASVPLLKALLLAETSRDGERTCLPAVEERSWGGGDVGAAQRPRGWGASLQWRVGGEGG